MLAVGALISFLGVPAGLLGNELSLRCGLRNIATLVFLLSALAGGLLGFTAMLPYIAVLSLAVVSGFIVQGNFSNLTSGVLAVAAPRHGGATIGLYSCVGFGGVPRNAPVRHHPRSIRRDIAARPWILSFGTCGLACLAGAAATIFLSRDGVTTRKCSECTTSWTKHERAARWYVRCTLDGCRSGGGRRHVSDVPGADLRPPQILLMQMAEKGRPRRGRHS